MFLDGFDAVVGAGGVKSAVGANKGPDSELVEADEEDHALTTLRGRSQLPSQLE